MVLGTTPRVVCAETSSTRSRSSPAAPDAARLASGSISFDPEPQGQARGVSPSARTHALTQLAPSPTAPGSVLPGLRTRIPKRPGSASAWMPTADPARPDATPSNGPLTPSQGKRRNLMHVGISKTPGSFRPARTRSRSITSSCAGTPPKSKKPRYCRVFPWNRPSGPAFHRTAGGAAPPVETRIPPGHPLCSKGCGSEVAGEDTLCPAGSRREPGFVTPDLGGPFSGNGPKAPESEVVVATGRRKRTRGRCPQGCGHEIQGTSGLCRNCDRKSQDCR